MASLAKTRNKLVKIPFYYANRAAKDYCRFYPEDICYHYNSLYLVLQTEKEVNNVIVFNNGKRMPPKLLIKVILEWLVILYKIHGIEFISLYKEHKGWSIMKRFLTLQDTEDKDQYYASISDNITTLEEVINEISITGQ